MHHSLGVHPFSVSVFAALLMLVAGCQSTHTQPVATSPQSASPGAVHPGAQTMWTTATSIPPHINRFADVFCMTASDCIAVGQTNDIRGIIVRTQDGGNNWVEVARSERAISVDEVVCTTATVCAAVANPVVAGTGLLFLSVDGGATWTERDLPDGMDLRHLSCSDQSFCRAVGFTKGAPAVFSSSDLEHWAALTGPQPNVNSDGYADVACLNDRRCLVVFGDDHGKGRVSLISEDGAVWTDRSPSPSLSPQVATIACTTDSGCVVGGVNLIDSTYDEGMHWTNKQAPSPEGVYLVTDVACASDSICVAAAESALLRRDGIGGWTSR